MKHTIFRAPGYIASHPTGNRSEERDTESGSYTRWDESGNVVETRPLTAEEIASLTPAPDSRAEKIADIEARLADKPLLVDESSEIMADLLALVKGGI